MTRAKGTSTSALLVSAVLVSTLAGCTLTINPPSSPSSTEPSAVAEAPSASPEAEPDLEPAPLSISSCDDLLTLAQARSVLDAPTAVLLGEDPANEYTPWYYDPTVVSAISGLTVARKCWWGVPNSGYSFTALVGEIDPAIRSSIEAALTAEGFSATSLGARTVYAIEDNDGDIAESHQFIGDVWILSNGPDLDITGVAADYAYEAMLAANPGLGR